MKNLAAVFFAAFFTFTASNQLSSANDTSAWDDIEMGSIKLQNDGSVSEGEASIFQEVIILGSKGDTEEAITALNEFLKGNRNSSLREVSREAMSQLIKQRKESAHYAAVAAGQPRACTLEMKVCPDGSIVGHEGPNCAYAACQKK